jgi:hypothetical protein
VVTPVVQVTVIIFLKMISWFNSCKLNLKLNPKNSDPQVLLLILLMIQVIKDKWLSPILLDSTNNWILGNGWIPWRKELSMLIKFKICKITINLWFLILSLKTKPSKCYLIGLDPLKSLTLKYGWLLLLKIKPSVI